jgi:hypothetical protein
MDNAKHVGRVGGLAVALGVGLAIASTPDTAWADDANAGATSAPAQNAAPEAAGAKAGKTKHTPGKSSSAKQRGKSPNRRRPKIPRSRRRPP